MIGFVGLGRMGGGMARQLLARSGPVIAYDPDPEAAARFAAAGGSLAPSPRAVADEADIIFASLPTIAISEAVALGPEGIAHGRKARIYIETSTIGSGLVRQIAEKLREKSGIALLDAPVSGGPKGAEDGTLTTIVAGSRSVFDEAEPFLAKIASHIVFAGETEGLGQVYKIVNNYIVMSSLAATCEAIATGVRCGADEATLIEVLNHSTGKNFATDFYFPSVIQPRLKVPSLAMSAKDVSLFVEMARSAGLKSAGGEAILAEWLPAASGDRNIVDWYSAMLEAPPEGD